MSNQSNSSSRSLSFKTARSFSESPRARSDGSLSPGQLARLGLPRCVPPVVASMIGRRSPVQRDIDRLQEIIDILNHIQTNPQQFSGRRNSYNVDLEATRIGEILEGIETDILTYPIYAIAFGSTGYRYESTYRLYGPTTEMIDTPEGGIREVGLCQDNEDIDDYMVGAPGTQYWCDLTNYTNGWAGEVPHHVMNGSMPYPGIFADFIKFLRKLISHLRQISVTRGLGRGIRNTKKKRRGRKNKGRKTKGRKTKGKRTKRRNN